MEGFTQTPDKELILHKIGAPVTSTQDGQVLDSGGSPVAKILNTGPGSWRSGTELRVNVVDAAVGVGATYQINLLGRSNGGSYVNLAKCEVPSGAVSIGKARRFPVSNLYWDGVPQDEVKVEIEIAGTSGESFDGTISIVRVV